MDFAIPGKAELLGMCSPEEVYQRGEVEVGGANHFELDRRGGRFASLALKAFQRSAADKVMDAPNNIRPPVVLYYATEYLRDCIAD